MPALGVSLTQVLEQVARTLNQSPLGSACNANSQQAQSVLNYLGVMLSIDARLREFGNHAVINPIHVRKPAKHSGGRRKLLGQDARRHLELQAVCESRGVDIGVLQGIQRYEVDEARLTRGDEQESFG